MQAIIAKLTAKDDKYACAIADKIISESQDTDEWYEFFDAFASLLNHPKSLVRNRVLYILSANAQWDDERELVHTPDSEYAILREIILIWAWGFPFLTTQTEQSSDQITVSMYSLPSSR